MGTHNFVHLNAFTALDMGEEFSELAVNAYIALALFRMKLSSVVDFHRLTLVFWNTVSCHISK